MQNLLIHNKICIFKSSAARTAFEQFCYAGNVFKSSKTRFRAAKNTNAVLAAVDLEMHILL